MRKILQLDNFFIEKLHADWLGAYAKTGTTEECRLHYDVAKHPREANRFRLSLDVKVIPTKKVTKAGYEIDARIVGFFSFPEGVKEDAMQMAVRLNGCFILYGILRGEIAAFTGSFGGGKFVLPTVDMMKVVEGIENKRAKSSRLAAAKGIARARAKTARR